MREIKFRAWDKQDNKMIESAYIEKINYFSGGIECGDGIGNDKFCTFENVVLMQFTGLKDKNGKEIYEGDILDSEIGAEGDFEPVVFKEGSFVIGPEEYSVREWVDDFRGSIIGNIYENPELLESEND